MCTVCVASGVTGGFDPPLPPFDITPEKLLDVPDSDEIVQVNIGDGRDADAPSEGRLADLEKAVSLIEPGNACGFVFLDVGTGRGLAYHASTELDIASASKAPSMYYAMTQGAASDPVDRQNIASAIVYSSNDAFKSVAFKYTGIDYSEWLASRGIDHEAYLVYVFLQACPRGLASAWEEIREYVSVGSDDARWFGELLSETEVSFIRDGLAAYTDTDASGARVMSKAEWASYEGSSAVADAAVIEEGGRTYLMVVETDQAYSVPAAAKVSNLAGALFDLRDWI